MSMKLTTLGVAVAAAMILVPHGSGDAGRAQAQPVVAAAAPANSGGMTVGKVIAAQGNAALVQIRAEVTRPMPPDLSQVAMAEQHE